MVGGSFDGVGDIRPIFSRGDFFWEEVLIPFPNFDPVTFEGRKYSFLELDDNMPKYCFGR